MVANTGAYASGWWWYYGQTASQVTALLSANKARLISIDPYQTSAGLRFAVVMIPIQAIRPGPGGGTTASPAPRSGNCSAGTMRA